MKKNSVAHQHAAPEAGDRHKAEVEQRAAAACGQPVLEPEEGGRQEWHGGQHDERPGGPALIAALGQREHQAGQRQREKRGAADVEPLAMAGAGLRHQPPGREHDREADRQLGQEHRAPAEPERAPLDQRAAGELAEGGGEAHHHPVEAERPGKFAPRSGTARGSSRAPAAPASPRRCPAGRGRSPAAAGSWRGRTGCWSRRSPPCRSGTVAGGHRGRRGALR